MKGIVIFHSISEETERISSLPKVTQVAGRAGI